MTRIECTLYHGDEKMASYDSKNKSEAVARNSALMKAASDHDWDDHPEVTVKCERR